MKNTKHIKTAQGATVIMTAECIAGCPQGLSLLVKFEGTYEDLDNLVGIQLNVEGDVYNFCTSIFKALNTSNCDSINGADVIGFAIGELRKWKGTIACSCCEDKPE